MHDRWWQVFGTQDLARLEKVRPTELGITPLGTELRVGEITKVADRMNTLGGELFSFITQIVPAKFSPALSKLP